jgi:hypothetical protein
MASDKLQCIKHKTSFIIRPIPRNNNPIIIREPTNNNIREQSIVKALRFKKFKTKVKVKKTFRYKMFSDS